MIASAAPSACSSRAVPLAVRDKITATTHHGSAPRAAHVLSSAGIATKSTRAHRAALLGTGACHGTSKSTTSTSTGAEQGTPAAAAAEAAAVAGAAAAGALMTMLKLAWWMMVMVAGAWTATGMVGAVRTVLRMAGT